MLRVNTPRLSGFLHCAAALTLVWACSSDDKTPSSAGGGDASTNAGAPGHSGAAGEPGSTGGSSNPMAGAPAAGDAGAGAVGGAAGAGGEPAPPECVEPSDCVAPETKPIGCAEAQCQDGKCEFSARDADGDTFLAKRCESLDPAIDVVTGDDCDDGDDQVNPQGWDGPAADGHENGCNDQIDQDCSGIVDDQLGANQATCTCAPNDTEPCGSTASGLPIDYPILDEVTGKPVGECKLGSRECLPNGTWGACTNAVGPIAEVCDNKNNDCDANTDEDPTNPKQIYCDADKDNHIASASVHQVACKPAGVCAGEWRSFEAVPTLDDCDDTDPNNFPGKTETCDGADNNCDGVVDGKLTTDDLKKVYYQDKDNDTYGTDASLTLACAAPGATGWVLSGGDCQDTGAGAGAVHPNAAEICNGKDDDCNGAVDTALTDTPSQPNTQYACTNGGWTITQCPTNKLHCTGPVTAGCETDATAMTSCHACNVACFFDCGSAACNELVAVAAGLNHSCSLSAEGAAWCWGANNKGQLGDSSNTQRNNPTAVSGLSGATLIGAGFRHTCAVSGASNSLSCWGDNAEGQLGTAAINAGSSVPLAATDMTSVVSVALGDAHTCAVVSAGQVYCWGRNLTGQVGNGDTSVTPAAVALPGTVLDAAFEVIADAKQVVTGAAHTCVLHANKTVSCWGSNASKQLGNAGGNSAVASPVAGLTGVTQLAAGYSYTCALAGAKVYCWGSNANKELGQAGAGPYSSPQEVPSLTNAVAIAAGFETTCVIRSGGALECWGGNASGARGDASLVASASRTVVGISGVTRISSGMGKQACALRSTKDGYCWGENGFFQLGKTGANTHVPQLIVE